MYAQYSKQLNDAKGYAFCYCIQSRYAKVDSAFSQRLKDYSGSYFVQQGAIAIETMQAIESYIDQNYSRFYTGRPSENRKGNMVSLTCWRLYESADFGRYLKNLLRPHKRKKT
jgi:hypothetical protein